MTVPSVVSKTEKYISLRTFTEHFSFCRRKPEAYILLCRCNKFSGCTRRKSRSKSFCYEMFLRRSFANATFTFLIFLLSHPCQFPFLPSRVSLERFGLHLFLPISLCSLVRLFPLPLQIHAKTFFYAMFILEFFFTLFSVWKKCHLRLRSPKNTLFFSFLSSFLKLFMLFLNLHFIFIFSFYYFLSCVCSLMYLLQNFHDHSLASDVFSSIVYRQSPQNDYTSWNSKGWRCLSSSNSVKRHKIKIEILDSEKMKIQSFDVKCL